MKVLDFGLARFEAGEAGSAVDLTHSPTLVDVAWKRGAPDVELCRGAARDPVFEDDGALRRRLALILAGSLSW